MALCLNLQSLQRLLSIGLLAGVASDETCFRRSSDQCNARLTMSMWGLMARPHQSPCLVRLQSLCCKIKQALPLANVYWCWSPLLYVLELRPNCHGQFALIELCMCMQHLSEYTIRIVVISTPKLHHSETSPATCAEVHRLCSFFSEWSHESDPAKEMLQTHWKV